jgi:hypothetical protein
MLTLPCRQPGLFSLAPGVENSGPKTENTWMSGLTFTYKKDYPRLSSPWTRESVLAEAMEYLCTSGPQEGHRVEDFRYVMSAGTPHVAFPCTKCQKHVWLHMDNLKYKAEADSADYLGLPSWPPSK